MFDKFKQVGEALKMKGQLQQMQKQLAQEVVEYEENDIKVVATGDQKIKELVIDGEQDNKLRDAINKALDKSRETAAKKAQEAFGDFSRLLG